MVWLARDLRISEDLMLSLTQPSVRRRAPQHSPEAFEPNTIMPIVP